MAECNKPTTPCWQTGTLKNCASYGTEGACLGDPCCGPWTPGGDCQGTNSQSCGSYPNCNSTCCNNVFSSCSGTNTGTCGTYPNCGSCCDGTPADYCAGGTVSYACAGHTQAQCTTDPVSRCCHWSGTACAKNNCSQNNPRVLGANCSFCGCNPAGGTCAKKACSSITSSSTCSACGCTRSGSCTHKACSSLGASCTSCTGCSQSGGTCATKACSALATSAICKSCPGCSCCWQITTACEITSDVTAYTLSIEAGGSVTNSAVITLETMRFVPSTNAYKKSGSGVLRWTGGTRCCD